MGRERRHDDPRPRRRGRRPAIPRIVYVSTSTSTATRTAASSTRPTGGTSARASSAGTTRPSTGPTRSPEQRIAAGAPVIIVLPSQVYGPGDHTSFGEQLRLAYEGKLPYLALGGVRIALVHVGRPRRGDRRRAGSGQARRGVQPRGADDARSARRWRSPRGSAAGAPPRLTLPDGLLRAAGAPRRPRSASRTSREVVVAVVGRDVLGDPGQGGGRARVRAARPRAGLPRHCSRTPDLHSDHGPRAPDVRPDAGSPRAVAERDLDRDGRRPVRPGRRRHGPAPPPPGLDQGADAVGRQLPRPQGPAARPQPQHRVRGGPLPQHRGLLGPAHGHRDDPGRRVHPCLRLLRDQDRQAHLVRRRRAATRRRGGRGDAPRARGGHVGRPRRPARRGRGRLRGHDPRAPPAQPRDGRGGPDPRLQRRGAAAADGDGGRAGHPQPQPRDRRAASRSPSASGRAGSGRLGVLERAKVYAGRVRPRGAHEELADGRPGRDARRADRGVRGAARGRRRHPDHRPVPATDRAAPAADPLLPPRRVRRDEGRGPRAGLQARRVGAAGPVQLPRPRPGPGRRAQGPPPPGDDRRRWPRRPGLAG